MSNLQLMNIVRYATRACSRGNSRKAHYCDNLSHEIFTHEKLRRIWSRIQIQNPSTKSKVSQFSAN